MSSISTGTGDLGETSLLYGVRVPKTHPRIEANGAVDTLMSAIGVARAQLKERGEIDAELKAIQEWLLRLATEVAVPDSHRERYEKAENLPRVRQPQVDILVGRIQELETTITFEGFVLPGEGSVPSAALDLARVQARSAERALLRVRETGESIADDLLRYLNRLSDLLWLLARMV